MTLGNQSMDEQLVRVEHGGVARWIGKHKGLHDYRSLALSIQNQVMTDRLEVARGAESRSMDKDT